MKCPVCGSQKFYVKDPEDEYSTCEFELQAGKPVFEDAPQEMQPETETYCCRCSWHDQFKALQK